MQINNNKESGYIFINTKRNFLVQGVQALGECTAVPLMALTGTIATVVSNLLYLMIKGGKFFIPSSYSKKYEQKLTSPLAHFALSTTKHTAQSYSRIVTSFFGEEQIKKTERKIAIKVASLYFPPSNPTPEPPPKDIPLEIKVEPKTPPNKKRALAIATSIGVIALLSFSRWGIRPVMKTALLGGTLATGGALCYAGAKDISKKQYKQGVAKLGSGILAITTALYFISLNTELSHSKPPMLDEDFAGNSQNSHSSKNNENPQGSANGNPPPFKNSKKTPSSVNGNPPPSKNQGPKPCKDRHITFGTTYINAGKPERIEMSILADKNHQEYCDKWGLTHEVVDKNLLENQCTNPITKKQENCVAYWNKIKLFKNWLEEPAKFPDKEEIRFYLDDDVLVTDMTQNPYEAFDKLRSTAKQSFIVARDVQKWNNGDPVSSVNTGILIVRKNKASTNLINEIWEQRNKEFDLNDPTCLTLGLCKNQKVMHEQQALANVITEKRSEGILDKVISVVLPRHSSGIAINTFHRAGCFRRKEENWHISDEIDYQRDDWVSYPEGKWRFGDWMGQLAGVPPLGWYCREYDTYQNFGSPPPHPIRTEMMKGLLSQVKK